MNDRVYRVWTPLLVIAVLLLTLPGIAAASPNSSPDDPVQGSGIAPTWTLRTGSLMDPRTGFCMDTDPVSGQILVFGGRAVFDLDDLWALAPGASTWEPVTTIDTPPSRTEAALTFLGTSGQALLFSGIDSGGSVFDDTCLLNLSQRSWQTLAPSVHPSPRGGHTMVWAGDRAILFGGKDDWSPFQFNTLNDTWSFDPLTQEWTELHPANPPPARVYHAMAYDPISGKVILFGGRTGPGESSLSDTWAYDPPANTWTELHPNLSPQTRAEHAMCALGDTGKILLYGGRSWPDWDVYHQTYFFDTATGQWQSVTPEKEPTAAILTGLAYDARDHRAVLFGGAFDPRWGPSNETWAFDDSIVAWSRLDIGNPPSARESIEGAYDALRGRFLTFGGGYKTYDALLWQECGETCIYDVQANQWSILPEDETGPAAREEACFTYSPSLDQAMLFGGVNVEVLNDLWVLSPDGTWTRITAENPPQELCGAAMVANPETGEVVLFGGRNIDKKSKEIHWFGDTYLYDPVANCWTKLDLTTHPSPRFWHKMVWDDVTGRVLLFGGWEPFWSDEDCCHNDLWSFDFATRQWTELHPIGELPPTRANGGMAWDSTRKKAVIFGGQYYIDGGGLLNDTWTYDPATNRWEMLQTAASPPTVCRFAMVYDSLWDQALIFGGFQMPGSYHRNDCWALTFQTTLGYFLTPGWNLITVPLRIVPTSADDAFPADCVLYAWDALHSRYLGRSQIALEPGAGYWLKSTLPSLALTGAPLAAPERTVALANGWNLIGNPFANDIPWDEVSLRSGGETMTLDQAFSRGLLAPALVAWNGTGYFPIASGGAFPTKAGFWAKALASGLEMIWANP